MQVHKPMSLGLSTRPIEYRRRYGLCVTASLHIPFAQAEGGTLWGEQSMWTFLAEEMAVPLIDEGIAKLTPEFLVHGRAHADPARPGACAVRAQVGPLQKTLLVFGERHWHGDRPTAPQPFESLPLDWAHAYGGADFALNPAGRGRTAVDGVHWLPNIESPAARLQRPDQAVPPAGFGALEPLHPWRTAHRGTYDESYLREHAPGFAPDLDWRHFNMAPPDQWFEQPLRGDETFAFDHLHPTRPRVEGRLPGLRARVFADYALAGGETRLREVPLRLTTLWFFPHAERAIALFQGLAEIATDDGSDIRCLLGAVERVGALRDDAHYAAVLDKRADPAMGALQALNDADLLPEGLDDLDPDAELRRQAFAGDQLQADAQRRRAESEVTLARAQARALGKDPDALGLRMPPVDRAPTRPAELVAYLERQQKEAQRQHWAMLDDVLTQAEKALEMAARQKLDLPALAHRGPPRFNAEERLAEMAALAQGRAFDRPGMHAGLVRQEAAERMGYLQSAHAQLPAAPMAPAPARALRAEIERAVAVGLRQFARMDLTGADLSGLDLRGCDFAGAWLESANLSQANISGADFTAAVLAHADLRGVVAVGTRLMGANLGRARLSGAVFDEAQLEQATLMHCGFGDTQWRRATLTGAMLFESQWGRVDWTGAVAPGQTFHKLDLQGLVLAEADLTAATFIECALDGVDLRGARLSQATFMGCRLAGARLGGALLDGAVFAQQCDAAGADFSQARLVGANLGSMGLAGARFAQSRLDGAFLCEADFTGADLRLASAQGALLRRTRLRGAQMAGINLKDAVLQHADLRGADLRRSNLFAADLSRVRLDGDVRLEGALLTRARTWPRLTPQQQGAA